MLIQTVITAIVVHTEFTHAIFDNASLVDANILSSLKHYRKVPALTHVLSVRASTNATLPQCRFVVCICIALSQVIYFLVDTVSTRLL